MKESVQVYWFTTVQFEATTLVGANGRARRTTGSTAHAKQMGTSLTACGQNAHTWFKLWDVPFERAGHDRCRACDDVVQGRDHGSPDGSGCLATSSAYTPRSGSASTTLPDRRSALAT
jgi:hypothetical protein